MRLFCREQSGYLKLLVATLMLAVTVESSFAEEKTTTQPKKTPKAERNAFMKTLGGLQFWGDVHFFHDWRIQQNVVTGHHRLLDGADYRFTAGTYEECRKKLDEIRVEKKLPDMSGKAVVLVHGIIRSSKSMKKMRDAFIKEGYSVFSFDYPSTQLKITEAAEYLGSAVRSLEGIEEINFVVHSMGGLVVRAYLAKRRDKRIKRMAMLGVPNLGAQMADIVKKNPLFKMIFGPAGQQLVTDPKGLIASLPTPEFEFAVVAGARGTDNGYNPLIPGDDDGTVSVANTRLPGATDFIGIDCLHSFMMNYDEIIECCVRFVAKGYLRENGEREPIPKVEEKAGSANTSASE